MRISCLFVLLFGLFSLAWTQLPDSDQDGVPNEIDEQPYSPKGCAVDEYGVAIDTDRDGVPDSTDRQPYSPKGCAVDEYGVAIDTDRDGVPDCYDQEPNSEPGMYYDIPGTHCFIKFPSDTPRVLLPELLFEEPMVQPKYYPELYYIAMTLKQDTTLHFTLQAYASDAAFAQAISHATLSYLAKVYQVPPSRFTLAIALPDSSYVPAKVAFEQK